MSFHGAIVACSRQHSAYMACGAAMVLPWQFHGALTVPPWCFHGAFVGSIWNHCASMVFPWTSTAVLQWKFHWGMLQPWCSKGSLMRSALVVAYALPRGFHDASVGLAHGSICVRRASAALPWCMVSPWCVISAQVVSAWYFYDVYTVLPWDFHGVSMVLSWRGASVEPE